MTLTELKEARDKGDSRLFKLKEAAQFVNISLPHFRLLAKEKKIRGRKIGREWHFHPELLREDIKSLLEEEMENDTWESSKEKTALTGGYHTRTQKVKEYEKVLRLKERAKKAKSLPPTS